MYEEFDKQELEKKLLRAKDTIFKLIAQFHHASTIDDSEDLYIYNNCESALESAFNVLGIEENYIPLMDFCKMWENNSRALWAINIPTAPFFGTTAEMHYELFKEEYELWQRTLEEIANEDY